MFLHRYLLQVNIIRTKRPFLRPENGLYAEPDTVLCIQMNYEPFPNILTGNVLRRGFVLMRLGDGEIRGGKIPNRPPSRTLSPPYFRKPRQNCYLIFWKSQLTSTTFHLSSLKFAEKASARDFWASARIEMS